MRPCLRNKVLRLCCTNIFWNSGWFFVVVVGVLILPSWHTCLSAVTSDRFSGSSMGHGQGVNYALDSRCSTLVESKPRQLPSSSILNRAAKVVKQILTIGFLTPYNQNQLSLGAMRLAVERVNNDSSLLPGHKLNFIAADIGSSDLELTSLPIRIMTEMRDNGTVAFIGGPEDSCVSEALVSAAWNLPIISYKCSDYQVSDKKTYSTFARTLPPSSKVSKSVVALLKKFEWDKIVLVLCQWKKDRWYQNLEAFKKLAKKHGINITETFRLHDYIPDKFSEMEQIVTDSFEKTRVYVFMGEHLALVDLVRALDNRKLLDKGEYIVISVDDKMCDPKVECNYIETEYLPDDFHVYLNHTEHNASLAKEIEDLHRRKVKAFRSVLKLQSSYPRLDNYSDTFRLFANYSTGYPFFVPYHPLFFADAEVPIEAAYLYDAVMIYTRALSEGLTLGLDPRNGTAIFERIRNRSYQSIQGFDVFIDANGDAEGNYTVLALLPDNTLGENSLGYSMQPVGYFRQNASMGPSNTIIPSFHYFAERSGGIDWVGGQVPKSGPSCGFRGEKCIYKPEWSTIFVGTFFGSFLLIATILVARHYRYEQKLACLLWKIDMRDVIMIPSGAPETVPKNTVSLCRQLLPIDTEAPHDLATTKKAYTRIGFYKGTAVAIKHIHKRNIDLTRNIRKELKQIREFRHENIIPFIGASVESGNICILTAYSARGSLEDVLQNEDLHLDNMFLASLVADLIKGMIFLHDSEIISHGNLKSSNCLVDSRWVLQITDFGLHEFKAAQDVRDIEKERRSLLWRSPELIRHPVPPRGTQKGDVYSFGIVLHEMIGRSGPWGKCQLTTEEIIQRVSNPSLNDGQYLRPSTFHLDCGQSVLKCLEACWEEDPELRPDFRFIRIKLKEMQAGLKPNIFDNMLSIMEKYACNLEDLVQDRTVQLMEEKKKTDALLHRMLPPSVAESLKRGEPVKAESFDSVTIYFSDIVGFTSLSATSTPFQVVELLNDLYTCFDSIISSYDVYKVETIGDAYMVVSGLPLRNGNRHAGEIASMALHLLDRIQSFEIRHRPGERLKLRIGIHSGPVVAGVVGLKMPRYCLFGDTVNTASRMESYGEPLRIHISDFTKTVLETLGGYFYSERGIIPIKGKGEMRTYWLNGQEPSKALRSTTTSESDTSNSASASVTLLNCSPESGKKVTSPTQPTDSSCNFLTTSLLSEFSDSNSDKLAEYQKSNRYLSCSNILQECKATLRKELNKKTVPGSSHRFRSAPIITFMDTISPKSSYHERNFV